MGSKAKSSPLPRSILVFAANDDNKRELADQLALAVRGSYPILCKTPLGFLTDEVHLPRRDHISCARNRIKHLTYFPVADSFFLHFGHRYLEDASYAAVQEDFELVELSLPEGPRLGAPK